MYINGVIKRLSNEQLMKYKLFEYWILTQVPEVTNISFYKIIPCTIVQ